MLELPQGANTDAQTPNGTKPNQEIEEIFTKKKKKQEPQPIFEKSPILRTLTNFLHNL